MKLQTTFILFILYVSSSSMEMNVGFTELNQLKKNCAFVVLGVLLDINVLAQR